MMDDGDDLLSVAFSLRDMVDVADQVNVCACGRCSGLMYAISCATSTRSISSLNPGYFCYPRSMH